MSDEQATEVDTLKAELFNLRLEKLTPNCSREQRSDITRSISQTTDGEYLHFGEYHLSKALDNLRTTKPHYFINEEAGGRNIGHQVNTYPDYSYQPQVKLSHYDALRLAAESGDYKAYRKLRMSDAD